MPTLIRLFTDLSVYRQVVTDKLSSSLLRFGLAYLLISLALGIYVNAKYTPEVYPVITTFTTQMLEVIPESATFELKDGILSSTASISSTYVSINPEADAPMLASAAGFLAFGKTHFRLTTDLDGTTEVRSYRQEGWPNFTLSGQEIRDDMKTFEQVSAAIKPYLPLLFTLPIFIFYMVARIAHSLFYALILRMFGSSLNRAYHFTHYWQLTLHTVIVADTLNLLVLIVYRQNYPLVFTIAFLATTLLAYLNLPVEPKRPADMAGPMK